MKKILLLLVAVGGLLTACNNEGSEWIEVDYSQDLVGTWICHQPDVSAAMEIKADGSVIATTLANGEYSENVPGKIEVENNKVCLTLEDGTIFQGLLEIILGESFVIVDEERGLRLTHHICKQDLADEIIGMWVCNDSKIDAQDDMMIQTFETNGTTTLTGFLPMGDNTDYVLDDQTDYKVVGDLMFLAIPADKVGGDKPKYIAERLIYTPKATALGDVMIFTNYSSDNNELLSESWLRIRQSLELENQKYDYSNIYITNVKAKDAEFEFAGQTLNLATMDGKFLDKMLKNILFNVSFPTSDEIVYNCYYNGQSVSMPAPIVVEGNKMTIKKSAKNPVYKDIDVWTFQDQDNTQMHMYMPTYTFENFLANTIVEMMANDGKLDLNDAEAVAAIYDAVAEAIETINVSFIFKDATRAL